MPIAAWDVARAPDLAALVAATLPDEALSADELAAVLWGHDGGVVLGAHDGSAVVAAAVRDHGRPVGFVTLVAVHPDQQRAGAGRELLDVAHRWLADRGASEARTGGAAPWYLWPGVDEDAHAAALQLFTAAGYEETGVEINQRCATTHRAEPPSGVELRRLRAGDDTERALAFARRQWPWWVDELEAAAATGCAHGAFDATTDDAIGFACHSVNRAGWIGPMATDTAHQGRGVGAALLGSLCRDLELAEFSEAEIAWVGPAAFYERVAGARVSRTFRFLQRAI